MAPHAGKLAASLIRRQLTTDDAEVVFDVWKAQEAKTEPKLVYDTYLEFLALHGEADSKRSVDAAEERGFLYSADDEYF